MGMKRLIRVMGTRKKSNTLVVITGPTAVGKTALAISLAKALQTEILSADSRQFYREMQVGTAMPGVHELEEVRHHFVGHLSIHDYYNVSLYEQQAMELISKLFNRHDYLVLTGGSGLYIDTLCHGIDQLPEVSPATRQKVKRYYQEGGLPALRALLKKVDPPYYAQVDQANPKRMMRALEVYFATGEAFSDLRKQVRAERDFQVKRIVLNRDRHELFDRINRRVDHMLHAGLVEEALSLFPHRGCNALNTVGYKEIFAWLSNVWPLQLAVEKIKTNTRRYAKRQLTWFRRYGDAHWFHPQEENEMLDWIRDAHSS